MALFKILTQELFLSRRRCWRRSSTTTRRRRSWRTTFATIAITGTGRGSSLRVSFTIMAGIATNGSHHSTGVVFIFVVLIFFKIFFVDLGGHGHHFAGHQFLWLGIAGKIGFVGLRITGMAKTATLPQGVRPIVHYLFHFIMGDVFRQYFQVFKSLLLLLSGGLHSCSGNKDYHCR